MHIFATRSSETRALVTARPRGAEITTANIDFRLLLFYSLSLTPYCTANHSPRNEEKLLNSIFAANDLRASDMNRGRRLRIPDYLCDLRMRLDKLRGRTSLFIGAIYFST